MVGIYHKSDQSSIQAHLPLPMHIYHPNPNPIVTYLINMTAQQSAHFVESWRFYPYKTPQ